MPKLESNFQARLIQEIKQTYRGCIVLKGNSATKQGVPDLIIFFEDAWATLECKRSANEVHQPNQDYYVDLMNKMSFSAFVFPENKEQVLDDLYNFFMSPR